MHINAIPAEDMAAASDLRGYELPFQTDCAVDLVSRPVDHLLDLLPFALLNALKVLNFLVCHVGGVY